MKRIMKSLPARLILGVIIGIAAGLAANEAFMNIVVTVKYILGELITFCVPLIIIGFIAPSITKLEQCFPHAGRGYCDCICFFGPGGTGIHGGRIRDNPASVNRI